MTGFHVTVSASAAAGLRPCGLDARTSTDLFILSRPLEAMYRLATFGEKVQLKTAMKDEIRGDRRQYRREEPGGSPCTETE